MAEENQTWHVDIILANGFVLTEVAAVVDTMRLTNRVCALPRFDWSFHTLAGGPVASPAGATIVTQTIPKKPTADFVFFIGNADPNKTDLAPLSIINQYRFAGATVYLLAEAATRYITQTQSETRHTTHWENQWLLREQAQVTAAKQSLAETDKAIVTCAGMGATTDIMLTLVGTLISDAVKLQVADILLHQTVRDQSTIQPFAGGMTHGSVGNRTMDRCIQMMKENIEEPLAIQEIVDRLGVSTRWLERNFKLHFRVTPNRFYRDLRLSKANNLLLNTSLSTRDVGMACGFSTDFARQYKEMFGVTPTAMRKARLKTTT